ncbi:MAG: hypothetical protein FWC58_09415, partial [Desulfobulbus sp.]|nr:hypothetical protein [Desulfobulbus sp.]
SRNPCGVWILRLRFAPRRMTMERVIRKYLNEKCSKSAEGAKAKRRQYGCTASEADKAID